MHVRKLGLLSLAAVLISTSALAEPFKSEAVITKVQGSVISARTVNGPITVHLTPETSIKKRADLPRRRPRPPRA
jgi:hypothetical protein